MRTRIRRRCVSRAMRWWRPHRRLCASRSRARAGATSESRAALFAGSRFSHIARWQIDMQLARTADEVATLAAFYVMRAGIVADFAGCTKMMKSNGAWTVRDAPVAAAFVRTARGAVFSPPSAVCISGDAHAGVVDEDVQPPLRRSSGGRVGIV